MMKKILKSYQRWIKTSRIEAQCHGWPPLRGDREHKGLLSEPRPCHTKGSGKIDCDAIWSSRYRQLTGPCNLTLQGLSLKVENDEKEISNLGLSHHTSITRIVAHALAPIQSPFSRQKRGSACLLKKLLDISGGESLAIGWWTDRLRELLSSCFPSFLFSLWEYGEIKKHLFCYTSMEENKLANKKKVKFEKIYLVFSHPTYDRQTNILSGFSILSRLSSCSFSTNHLSHKRGHKPRESVVLCRNLCDLQLL